MPAVASVSSSITTLNIPPVSLAAILSGDSVTGVCVWGWWGRWYVLSIIIEQVY